MSNRLWLYWAIDKTEHIRAKIRSVTRKYNQWPIIISGSSYRLPVDRPPERPVCLANDNTE